MRTKKKEGHPLKETPGMMAWKKEFEKMKVLDHEKKISGLGLYDEDLEEFKKDFGSKKKTKIYFCKIFNVFFAA